MSSFGFNPPHHIYLLIYLRDKSESFTICWFTPQMPPSSLGWYGLNPGCWNSLCLPCKWQEHSQLSKHLLPPKVCASEKSRIGEELKFKITCADTRSCHPMCWLKHCSECLSLILIPDSFASVLSAFEKHSFSLHPPICPQSRKFFFKWCLPPYFLLLSPSHF